VPPLDHDALTCLDYLLVARRFYIFVSFNLE
jgi:hypothetical protein